MPKISVIFLESDYDDQPITRSSTDCRPSERLALAWQGDVLGQPRPQGGIALAFVDVSEMPWVAC